MDKKPVSVLKEEYKKVLDDPNYPVLSESRKGVMAQLLENYRNHRHEEAIMEGTVTGDIDKYDPVLMPVIRRGIPNLIPMDIFGTQPMSAPTGLLFCIRSVFANTTTYPVKRGTEAAPLSYVLVLADATNFAVGGGISSAGSSGSGIVRYKEDNTILVQNYTGGVFATGNSVDNAIPYSSAETTVSTAYYNEAMYRHLFKNYAYFSSVALAEVAAANTPEMSVTIDKTSVSADSYKLKAKYSDELAQDMKAVHGLDADTELTKFLGLEVAAEQNRKFIDYLNTRALVGGTYTWNMASHAYGGDADGRWAAEKIFSFYQYINKIANSIAKTTLRGRGNFIVCSLDVASQLETLRHWIAAYAPNSGNSISGGIADVNLGQSAFVGILGGKYKVYVDMYAASDYCTVGYKGASEWDAGIFYCPYVPLYVKKGIGEEDGQPRLFFHTRYGLTDNPFGSAIYYRHIAVTL